MLELVPGMDGSDAGVFEPPSRGAETNVRDEEPEGAIRIAVGVLAIALIVSPAILGQHLLSSDAQDWQVAVVKVGPFSHSSRVVLAPMAGVTDRPFRDLCRGLGVYWAIGEMLTSNLKLWSSSKSTKRRVQNDEVGPRWVQIAGAVPAQMAEAAHACQQDGAEIIDINLGCPAKKVCNRAAGSALMKDEALVEQILSAVVSAVSIPVSLKMRLGWSLDHQNAVTIAQMAESLGVSLVTVHGRSRACRFGGPVHYDRILAVREAVRIPLLANGDIRSVEDARKVIEVTGADGVMIGRAAQGQPWLPGLIDRALAGSDDIDPPSWIEQLRLIRDHVHKLQCFYGDMQGVRIARKHVGWFLDAAQAYTPDHAKVNLFAQKKQRFNRLESADDQIHFFDELKTSDWLRALRVA